MAAKVKVTSKFDVVKILELLAPTEKILDEVGQFTKSRIQQFTRSGRTIALGGTEKKGGKAEPLKKLSASYVNYRKKLAGGLFQGDEFFGPKKQLSEFFKPSKSNLTLTGQLLKSISFKASFQSRSVSVEVSGSRDDSNLDNKEVAGFVAAQGRPFMGIDEAGRQRIKNIVNRALRRRLKAYNK